MLKRKKKCGANDLSCIHNSFEVVELVKTAFSIRGTEEREERNNLNSKKLRQKAAVVPKYEEQKCGLEKLCLSLKYN